MRLDLGSPVHCSDDAFGELADIVIDPQTRASRTWSSSRTTGRGRHGSCPIARARAGDDADATISLDAPSRR